MNKPEPNPGFPLHRLNTAETVGWVSFANSRRSFASVLAKKYRLTGVGLISSSGYLFVIIDAGGDYRSLKPPWKRFEMWQLANKPEHKTECACVNFLDPEVGGSWKERDGKEGHHPFCQFARTAAPVFQKFMKLSLHRQSEIAQGARITLVNPDERPDAWLKAKKDAQS
jgi:hypothetical protein